MKPQNVLIDAEGRAKITDFGIALSLESHGLTATGRVLGTTDYVSPEQAMGQEIDARTDVYSLGILLYEMLTGEVPFKAETQVGVAMKHVNETVPSVQRRRPDASAALAAAIEKSTAKEPKDRYPDMNAFLRDLEGALEVEVARAGGATGEATSVLDSVPEKRRRLVTRRRISWVGVLLLIAAAGAAIAIAALSGDSGRSQEPPPESTAAIGDPDRLGHRLRPRGRHRGAPRGHDARDRRQPADLLVDRGLLGRPRGGRQDRRRPLRRRRSRPSRRARWSSRPPAAAGPTRGLRLQPEDGADRDRRLGRPADRAS